jgi:cephalosporin hydroxylase
MNGTGLQESSMKHKRLSLWLFLLLIVAVVYFTTAKPTPPTDEDTIARFTQIYHTQNIHNRTKWLGIQTQENPCDLWAIQEIITEARPDFVVETGTYKGGGALFYASVLRNIGGRGKVITVDIELQHEEAAELELFRDRVEFIEGSSVSDEVINKIAARIKGARVMVTLDSDHHMSHVLKELRLYSKFVSPGGYLIVQDTSHNGHPLRTNYGKGPMEALEEFLKENKDFERDASREKFLLTFHPKGYLKKIR